MRFSSSILLGTLVGCAAMLGACTAQTDTEPVAIGEQGLSSQNRGNSSAVRACVKHFRLLAEALAPIDRGVNTREEFRGLRNFNDRFLHGLGGNGRACADCHVAKDDFALTPATVQARFDALRECQTILPNADDPLFRPIDADDFRTNGAAANDFTNLKNGLVRISLPLPANVKLLDCGSQVPCPATAQPTAETIADVWRAVPTINDVKLTGPDGQLPQWVRGPNQRGGYQWDARVDTLQNQAVGALFAHAEVDVAPAQPFLDDIAAFQNGQFSSKRVARLADSGSTDGLPADDTLSALELQGKAVFVRACAHCHGGPGLSTPQVAPPPFADGSTGMPRYHTITVDCPRPVDTVTPPRYVFPPCPSSVTRNIRTYEFTQPNGAKVRRSSSDPGRALLSGNDAGNPFNTDFQRYDNTGLHGISKTAPYFHNNSAQTLDDVLDQYEAQFDFIAALNPNSFIISTTVPGAKDRPFTKAERPALIAFLNKL